MSMVDSSAARAATLVSNLDTIDRGSLVFVVCDAQERRNCLADYLSTSGYNVEATSLEQAVKAVALRRPDAVLVVASLPDRRVSELVRSMWRWGQASAVTLLSDTGDLAERVLALEMGVNDLISDGCEPREILARINCHLRRSATPARGTWVLNERTRELVAPGGVSCELTPTGLALIDALIDQPDCMISDGRSSERSDVDGRPRNMRTIISRLRQRFAQRGVEGFPIRNIYGAGYILDAEIQRVAGLSS